MSKASKIKKRTKLSVVLLMCVAFVGSSLSVSAATVQTAKAYEYLYRASEVVTSSDVGEASEYILYTESGVTPGITLIEKESNILARAVYGFDWEVPARSRVSAAYFTLTEGQQVAVTASMIPANVEVRVGLENSNGTRRYISGTDILSYTFPIEQDGAYRVYIQNDSYTDVEAQGSYIIK